MAFDVNSVPIVRDDHAGLAAPFDQRRQFPRHAPAWDRGVRDRRQALPRHVIDDVQDAEPPAAAVAAVAALKQQAIVIIVGIEQSSKQNY